MNRIMGKDFDMRNMKDIKADLRKRRFSFM